MKGAITVRDKVFLYKENSDDRDCVAYIETEPLRFECGHYFGSPTLCGACYFGHSFANYEDITTVLTKAEYEQLVQFAKDINELGYGIKEGDDRYNKGVELCKAIQPVYDKLLSKENEELFSQILEVEKEYLMDEYYLTEDDIGLIYNEYTEDYRDRGIVGCVFQDTYDLGYEEAHSLGIIDTGFEKHGFPYDWYFDYEKFGKDLVNDDERYVELSDGRVVCLNY